jgi:hypothetical protein
MYTRELIIVHDDDLCAAGLRQPAADGSADEAAVEVAGDDGGRSRHRRTGVA